MSLSPVPSEQPGASCASCSAPLAPDQRYCLACGQPASPALADLRSVAFLDVLQAEAQPYAVGQNPAGAIPAGYAPVIEPVSGTYAWMRRYSGLFGLLSVLLLAIVVGLLVGHWVTQSSAPSRQVIKVEGLAPAASAPLASTAAASPAAASTTAAGATPKPAASAAASSKTSAKTEAHEAQEAQAIEHKPPPTAVKVNSTKLHKLGATTGRKHEEEVAALGAQPIETGG
jgi:hypothetical protein